MDDLDLPGYWWLPGSDSQVPGTLTFSDDDGGRLDLIGAFDTFDAHRADEPHPGGVYPRVHGAADGRQITLIDCFQTHLQMGFGNDSKETLHVSQVADGRLFHPAHAVGGDALSADVRHLTYWMADTGLGAGYGELTDRRFADVHADKVDVTEAGLAECTLSLVQHLGVSGDGVTGRGVNQHFEVRFDTERVRDIHDLLKWAGEFRALVAIGADRAAPFDRVHIWHPDTDDQHDTRFREPIGLHATWNDWKPPGNPVHTFEMPFTYRSVDGPDGLARWMATASTHTAALSRVMAARHRDGLFVSDRLMNYCAALERLDRDRTGITDGNDAWFVRRLGRCAALAGAPFSELVADVDQWATVVKDERNDVAHHFTSLGGGTRHHYLGESAFRLFTLCMLTLADLPDAATGLASHRNSDHLRLRLAEVL